jgi:hypothetical protein
MALDITPCDDTLMALGAVILAVFFFSVLLAHVDGNGA